MTQHDLRTSGPAPWPAWAPASSSGGWSSGTDDDKARLDVPRRGSRATRHERRRHHRTPPPSLTDGAPLEFMGFKPWPLLSARHAQATLIGEESDWAPIRTVSRLRCLRPAPSAQGGSAPEPDWEPVPWVQVESAPEPDYQDLRSRAPRRRHHLSRRRRTREKRHGRCAPPAPTLVGRTPERVCAVMRPRRSIGPAARP
jgi:hypothetical protein